MAFAVARSYRHGRHAIYDLDTRVLKVTGGDLASTPTREVDRRRQPRYQDGPQMRSRAATLRWYRLTVECAPTRTGHFQRQAGGKLDLVRLEAAAMSR